MELKSILESRVSDSKYRSQEHEVIGWMSRKADEIKNLASRHLKYVSHVFEEFDIHDAEHSEGVLGIIEDLLGDKASELSSYDLFSLIAVSYLHDCGMAVSDSEMEVLKMVEGKLDGQKPKTTSEAKQMILENMKTIYGNDNRGFDGEIRNWLFRPSNEEALIDCFAELLIDYHNYRNGKIDRIKDSEDLTKTNDELRVDYLRITHHQRIGKYMVFWGDTRFSDFPISGMGPLLANNIAKCCLAHGEDSEYIKNEFIDGTRVMYYGQETSNLQFVAMMLRLGDIIHFSYDRAHPVLRALHHFKSEYSYHQWHIKANGLSFNVSDGKVSCSAFCQSPKDYYDLWAYVDNIDLELLLFNSLSIKWEKDFPKIEINDKVDRKNIRHDPNFTPAHGRKFSLDQNKVLELLMGAKLYTNEYACLRELYQNSLDACRCQMAIAKSKDINLNSDPTGRIEFGIGEEKGRKYVYCLDNGKGMTKEIIENFLLHIGSSYYRSSEFFKKQAETGAKFTPTSQFGIGMLSCFMIGDEIEITTREEGNDVVSCVMEGPNEYFYYQTASREDSEKVPNSGTLVKVFLNEKYQSLLNDDPLEELGYLLWIKTGVVDYDSEISENVEKDIKKWNHHLYSIMNDFIIVVPPKIDVFISLKSPKKGKNSIMIYNKPLSLDGKLKEYAVINDGIDNSLKSWFEERKKQNYLTISEEENGLEFSVMLNISEIRSRGVFPRYNTKCSVDGIRIARLIRDESLLYGLYDRGLHSFSECVLNFTGKKRPQLSVNRDEIINASLTEYNGDVIELIKKIIKTSITEISLYLKEKGSSLDRNLYNNIWLQLFSVIGINIPFCYQLLKENNNCHDMLFPYPDTAMTFRDFLIKDKTIFHMDKLKNRLYHDFISIDLPLLRFLESDILELNDKSEIIVQGHKDIPWSVLDLERYDSDRFIFHPSGYNTFYNEFDAVRFSHFIFISDNFYHTLCEYLGNLKEEESVIQKNWLYSSRLYSVRSILSYINRGLMANMVRFSDKNIIDFIINDSFGDRFSDFFIDTKQSHDANSRIKYIGLTVFINDFTVLAFSDSELDSSICFARRGKCTQKELLDSVTGEWKDKIKNVLFLDGTVWNSDPSN